jgi:hypothetical protein
MITGTYKDKNGNLIEIWKNNEKFLINIIKADKTIGPFDIFGVLPGKINVLAEDLIITEINDKVLQLYDRGNSEFFSKI